MTIIQLVNYCLVCVAVMKSESYNRCVQFSTKEFILCS